MQRDRDQARGCLNPGHWQVPAKGRRQCAGGRRLRQAIVKSLRKRFTVQKVLAYLNDGASIILVASREEQRLSGRSTCTTLQGSIRSFARTWTSEFKDRKIRTNVLSPGPVNTPMFNGQFPSEEGAAEARKQITAMIPLARLGRP